jgi:hypothetical protein
MSSIRYGNNVPSPNGGSPQGFRSFEFDLPSALLEQLIGILDGMERAPLEPGTTGAIPSAQGVYQLFHDGKLVYIGKTDAEAGLPQRLSRHAWTIQSRHNLDVSEMSFKAVEVLVFSAMDLESALIKHYKNQKRTPAWNGSGFGNNDPGRKRDGTTLKSDGFDATYPINVDLPFDPPSASKALNAFEALASVMPCVPYKVRHEKTPEAIEELKGTKFKVPGGPVTLRQIVEAICTSLPPGWQATRLPGRVIVYREVEDDYPGGEIIARS